MSVKTAQRYEQELGLPVKRLSGRVSLSVAELEAWQEQQTEPPKGDDDAEAAVEKRPIWIWAAASLAAACLAGVFLYWYTHRTGPPASVHMDWYLLTVLDADARPVWHHQFAEPMYPVLHLSAISDMDKDGSLETVLVWPHVARDSKGWPLHCFSADGKIRWVLDIQDKVRNAAGKEFGPPYVIRDFAQFDSPEGDGTRWTAAVFVHVADDYSTLVVVDSAGKRRGQYWHVGHLNAVKMFDADGDGDLEIVAGGVRHGVDRAVLIAFDPARVAGTNPMPEGHPKALPAMVPSTEIRTAFLARSKVSQQKSRFNFVENLQIPNGFLRLIVYENIGQPYAFLLYDIAPGLRIHDVTVPPAYENAYRELPAGGQLPGFDAEQEIAELKAGYQVEPAP